MLTITDRREGGVLTLVLDGELDLSTHGNLVAALDKAMERSEGAADVVHIDCVRLRFCDSTGVHTFLLAHRRARTDGVTMRLVGVRGLVLRVLTICGAMKILTTT
jgi:anti-sigma B factor antagonist